MVRGRKVERPLEVGITEVRVLEIERHLDARRADAIIVGVVDVEHQVHRPTGDSDPGDVNLLQLDLGLLEVQLPQRGAGARDEDER